MSQNQAVNIDTVINGLVGGMIEFGTIVKQDKANSSAIIDKLQKELEELKGKSSGKAKK